MPTEDLRVERDDESQQYLVYVAGRRAGLADFQRKGDVVEIPHTEVDPSFGGRGVGSVLVQGALDDLLAEGLKVRPTCPFVRAWIDKHPKYADLVA